MAPSPDDLLVEATNEPAKRTNLDQNLSSVQDPPNLAINLDYHSSAPSFGLILQAPFCSTPPYQTICLGAAKPKNPMLGEMVFDKSNQCLGAVDECIVGTVLTSCQSCTTFNDKKKRQFYDSFVAGLPKGRGYKNVHLEDLMVAKDNDHAILAAVDIVCINETLDRKFHQTQSQDMFCSHIVGPSGQPSDVREVKNLFLDWMNVTPAQIIQLCAFFSLYSGNIIWNEDLMWSTDTILNSIEDEALKFRVQSCLEGYEEKHCVEPLTLYFTLMEVVFCDMKTIDGLSAALAKNHLENFNNENTAEHTHQHRVCSKS